MSRRCAAAGPRRCAGWTSAGRAVALLVLRSFVKPFFVRHAEGLLAREAAVLRLLAGTDVPAARLVAVDATARVLRPPLLVDVPAARAVRLDDEEADRRADLLARQLLRIHRLPVTGRARPRAYQAWTSPERVSPPEAPTSPSCGSGPWT